MTSKFFAAGSSESESEEEESSSESSSSEEEKPKKQTTSSRPEETVRRGPRKVVSQKDKRFDEMRSTVKQLKNAIKINDWNAISSDFQKINQQISKAFQLIQQEGIPRFYIKICVQLADLIENTSKDKEKVKKMSKTNAKSLNAMKQNIKKNNVQYEDEIKKYIEAPDEESGSEKGVASESGSEESDESGSESSDSEKSEKAAKPVKKPAKPAKPADDEDDNDEDESDEEWPSDSSSESEEEVDTSNLPKGPMRWLKKPGGGDSDDDGYEKVAKKEKKDPKKKVENKKKQENEETKVKEETKQIILTEDNVKKKMEEIQGMRGKKGTSKKDQISQLELLATAKISPSMTAQVLVQLISAQFDSSMQRGGVTHMPISFDIEGSPSRENCMWTKCMGNIRRLLVVLKENPELTEESTGQSAVGEARPVDVDYDDVEEQIQVTSNLVSFVERLDDELYLSLRLLDNHSPDFLKRLLDIAPFLELAELVQEYYQAAGQSKVAARIAIRRLEHLYYKHNSLVAKAATVTPQKGDRSQDREKFINDIAMQVYQFADDSIKTRAMLCHIYYHALHDRFYQARDMLLMSHLQDSIHQTHSVPTQILFNRTMAQVGLSAFRCGLIAEAHGCFDELCGNNRLKELLAQGLSSQRFNERTQEQERAEKRRQTPYHMHINLELVECCHLVGAVLIEIPKMVANSFDAKRKVTSRALKRVFENSDRNPLSGPPETTRDVIMAGARALEKGDWRQCEAHILSLPVWSHLGSEECVAKARVMLQSRIREEALRTFLFAYSAYYDALSLEQLCEMFELPKTAVNSLVSKMMIQDELLASWDQPTGSIVMHKKERSRLHHLAQQFSDLLGKVVDINEKSWDMKFGEGRYGYNKDPNKQGGGGWGQQGGGQRYRQDAGRAGGGSGGGGVGGNNQPRSDNRGPRDQGGSWRPVN